MEKNTFGMIEIISEIKKDPALLETLNGQSDIIAESGMDSLEMINFILRIEDEFDVEIDFDEFDLSHLGTIDHFLDFVVQRKVSP
ncbi:acyl carrier protein [Paenibacillus monticola]|uniref:Acyl carrier protein n=1 Tax=Paenibacillus monticola TaxID=2666075 RepID=A0A7X2L5B1_9BACL|nr:phosphopantetheine-binding protein [Paenibacillus monticola]MRN57278.1 acyl carrier protein [Paenibacillus monticola]